jgi:glycosyltransferase involved in cell wall biosynthesis
VPGAADPHAFVPVQNRKKVREALNLPMDRTILFTVRNLVPRMGLENLLSAVATLGVARQGCTLVIGGEGPLRGTLEAGIRQRGLDDVVRLAGFIPEAQLAQYYQAADLVVMPSLQLEGFGLVAVEAMACGTLVLGTPVGAIPEILNQVDPILVADGTDGRSLARALEQVLRRIQEPGEFGHLARKGRALIEGRYNWTQHCVDLVDVLIEQTHIQEAA